MFTGLVQTLAEVSSVTDAPPGRRLEIMASDLAAKATLGESVAINGCCLTVVAIDEGKLAFEAGPETLSRTTLGELAAGDHVNLERSLAVGDLMGGHFVSGHIDGVATLERRLDQGDWTTCWFRLHGDHARHMVGKGSVAVDGVSLTLVDVEEGRFSVALIPHTLSVTTLGGLAVGDRVNIETDLLAKYVDRILTSRAVSPAGARV